MEDPQESADRFRAIFDLCDEDKDGFIDVDHFTGLAKDHFGAEGLDVEVVTGVVNLLDPEGKGQISFEDFCRGVEQIVEIQQQAQISRGRPSVSEETDLSVSPSAASISSPTQMETSLLNENGSTCRVEGTDEENYEDFGEVESEADASDQGRTPVTHRKRGSKKDLLSRSHKKSGHTRRLTPTSLASQLQHSSRDVTPSSTRRSSFGSDEIFDDIDGNFQDLDGRVKQLEQQLVSLTEGQVDTKTKQAKLKDENSTLVSKVSYLEEQLRDMEVRAEERLTEERRSHQEHIARRDRESTQETYYATQRLRSMEAQYDTLKTETSKLRQEITKLRSEKLDLQERMLEKQEMYNALYEDNERLKAEYHKQETLHQRERKSMGQLLEELGKELEELRRYKMEVETGTRSPQDSVSEAPGRYDELHGEIHRLKEAMWEEWRDLLKENRGLQNSNEDLSAQLMTRCVEEGKSLLQNGGSQSLAQELEHLTKEELLQQLRQEQDYNSRLKEYVDRMLLTILEKNPSILEIKTMKR